MSRWFLVGLAMTIATHARAQSVTGTIEGRVLDSASGRPIEGTIVTLESKPVRTVRTDRAGMYRFAFVLPGTYVLAFEDDSEIAVHADLGSRVDAGATLLDGRYLTDIPLPGRTFEAALTGAPGAIPDSVGIGFAGSSSLENRYLVDGTDITELSFGLVGQRVPIEFIDEIRIAPGGSTGDLVEVVTKHGTNEWHGSVFGTIAPDVLAAAPKTPPRGLQTIDVTGEQAYTGDFGATLSGPIIKDRLWFFAGFAPAFARIDYTRRVLRELDRDQNGQPDVDPKTGFPIRQPLDSEIRSAPSRSYAALARMDAAITPEQQGAVSLLAVPSSAETPGLLGLESTGTREEGLAMDASAHWRAILLGGSLELEAVAAWHHASDDVSALDPSVAGQPQDLRLFGNFDQIGSLGGESNAAIAGCSDQRGRDPFPLIINCPVSQYATGGPGLISHTIQDRRALHISASEHIGTHTLRAGLDADQRDLESAQIYSGGFLVNQFDSIDQFRTGEIQLAAPGTTDPRFDRQCEVAGSSTTVPCRWLTSLADATDRYHATDMTAFAGDLWRVLPELQVEGGISYAAQRAGFILLGAWAPYFGVTYDPLQDGRNELFARWGRSFETIPLDALQRVDQHVGTQICGTFCSNITTGGGAFGRTAPDLEPEYVDDLLVGARVDRADWRLGALFHQRRLGRAIEDVAGSDGMLVVANPGEGIAASYDPSRREYEPIRSLQLPREPLRAIAAGSSACAEDRCRLRGALRSSQPARRRGPVS